MLLLLLLVDYDDGDDVGVVDNIVFHGDDGANDIYLQTSNVHP